MTSTLHQNFIKELNGIVKDIVAAGALMRYIS